MKILFGAGHYGTRALKYYGRENVAFFCDNYKSGETLEEIPVISFMELERCYREYEVVICIKNLSILYDIFLQLREKQIPFKIFNEDETYQGVKLLHIWGQFPDIQYDYKKDSEAGRAILTIELIKKTFSAYQDVFFGQKIDMWINYWDFISDGYKFKEIFQLPFLFMYYTHFAYKKDIIPIPDYRFISGADGFKYKELLQICRAKAEQPYEDSRAFWSGTPNYSLGREALIRLGEQHKDKLVVHAVNRGQLMAGLESSKEKFIPMTEQGRYKYLIDICGYGWTDRVKILLQLGRVVLLVDRPYEEWYFDDLIPNVHYVPVKENLSDLLEKINYLDGNPDEYKRIVENAKEFVREKLQPENVLAYMKDTILQYGCVRTF